MKIGFHDFFDTMTDRMNARRSQGIANKTEHDLLNKTGAVAMGGRGGGVLLRRANRGRDVVFDV